MATNSDRGIGPSAGRMWGLAISREAWLDHIDRDTELDVHHEDEHFIVASWNGLEGVFCHRNGLVTARESDAHTMDKLGAIARCGSPDPAPPAPVVDGEAGEERRVIPRTTAAAIVVIVGALAAAIGKGWMDYLQPASLLLEGPPPWLAFLARTLYTTGLAAVGIGWILALTAVYPWESRKSLYAAAVLGFGVVLAILI